MRKEKTRFELSDFNLIYNYDFFLNLFQRIEHEDGTVEVIPAEREVQYYVTEGAYGAFNNTIWDFQKPTPVAFKEIPADAPQQLTTFFGPTCDSLDVVAKRIQFPDMEIGDWIYFNNMGTFLSFCHHLFIHVPELKFPFLYFFVLFPYLLSVGAYTLTAASNFNGFESPHVYYKIFTTTNPVEST